MITRTRNRSATSKNPFNPDSSRPGISVTEQFEEAVVVDVVVNNEHPLYAIDGYNSGVVQFRFINSNYYSADENLSWAFPMDATITQYPLLHEMVYVVRGLNRWYYMKAFNVLNRPTSQPMFGFNTEAQPITSGADTTKALRATTASPNKAAQEGDYKLGEFFTEQTAVYRLKHTEGDITYEGRHGQSIRFGASWLDGDTGNVLKHPFLATTTDQSPNLLMRIGPDPQAKRTVISPFGLVVEDINLDKTSAWMVSDQLVPLKYATKNSGIHAVSVTDFPNQLDGNQYIINSDRFVINTKLDKIIGSSANGIHWMTLKDYTMDADGNHITWTTIDRKDRVVGNWRETVGKVLDISSVSDMTLTAGKTATIQSQAMVNAIAPKIHIGSAANEDEPIPLGETLRSFLEQVLEAILTTPLILTTGMPIGPSMMNPEIIAKLEALKEQYLSNGTQATILSLNNFTIRTNETPAAPRTISSYTEGT